MATVCAGADTQLISVTSYFWLEASKYYRLFIPSIKPIVKYVPEHLWIEHTKTEALQGLQ